MQSLDAPFVRGYLDAFTLSAPEVPPWTVLLERGATPAQRAAWQPLIAAYRDPLLPHTALPPIPVTLLRAITMGMNDAERMAITTTVGTRWWWGAAVTDPIPNYSLHQLIFPVLLQRIAVYCERFPPQTSKMAIHDDMFQQVLYLLRGFLRVPIRYTRDITPRRTWTAEMVVEDCPFCTLPDGCGVWYGLWSGLADWITHRFHPEQGVHEHVIIPRPTTNWHHVRFTKLWK